MDFRSPRSTGSTATAAQPVPLERPVADHRSNNFDFLRLAFASLVLFSHSFDFCAVEQEPLKRLTGWLSLGSLAVTCFFLISGYLITASLLASSSYGSYLRKRACRIYPGLAMVALVEILIIGPIGAPDAAEYFRHIHVLHAIAPVICGAGPELSPSFLDTHDKTVNASLWSIRYEGLCYLLVAAVGLAGMLKRRGVVLALWLALFVLNCELGSPGRHWGGRIGIFDLTLVVQTSVYFFAGALFYLYRDRIAFRPAVAAGCIGIILLCIASHRGLHIVLIPCVAYLLFLVAFSSAIPLQKAGRFGDFSYGIYLYGWPVQDLVYRCFGSHLSPLTMFLAAYPPTLLLAVGSWYLIEKPWLTMGRSRKPQVANGGPLVSNPTGS